MTKPAKPEREEERLAELHRYRILDTDPEQAYDDLLTIVAGICGTPMGAVSLIDGDRQWFKARQGLAMTETPRDVAFCAHAILEPDKLLHVPDSQLDERFADNPLAQGEGAIRFYAGAPLVSSSGNALGTLCVMDTAPRELTKEQSEALMRLSRQVVALMELRKAYTKLQHHLDERDWYEKQLKRYHEELEQQNAELAEQSRTDVLTGLPNRRAFNSALERAIENAGAGKRLHVAVVDIDHFKSINDLHGHAAGDETLAAVGRTIHAQRGPHGFAARLGGEEFGLFLTDSDELAAELQCEYIREAVQNLPVNIPATVSIGVAAFRSGDDAAALCARADEALYAAKRGGRNRVVVADAATAAMPKRAAPR
ncbi:MAG TPA: sensor domain-containing diguanylate cyclase [Rhodanobacteraceae bacterium]